MLQDPFYSVDCLQLDRFKHTSVKRSKKVSNFQAYIRR